MTSLVDSSIYIAGHTALAARQRFAEDGTKVLGSILDYWESKAGGGRYRYYNRYHYYKPYYQKG